MILVLRPRDGLTVKDPRGFNAGNGTLARSLAFPLPSTTAGAARTAVGLAGGFSPTHDPEQPDPRWATLYESVAVRGPLPVCRELRAGAADGAWTMLWPAPRDAVIAADPRRKARVVHRLKPAPVGAAAPRARGVWDYDADPVARAADALWPVVPPARTKPLATAPYWRHDLFERWLEGPGAVTTVRGSEEHALEARLDFHVGLDDVKLTNVEGQFFGVDTFEYLAKRAHQGAIEALETGIALEVTGGAPERGAWRLGGETRLAAAEEVDAAAFAAPRWLDASRWTPSRRVRLVVVTPAVFSNGWCPDWLQPRDERGVPVLAGPLPGSGLDVTLRAALVDRPLHASGWDLAAHAPRPSRRLVAPGAVYFLETTDPATVIDAEAAKNLWLRTLQVERTQEARDGYGLCVPGVWRD